MDSSFYDKFKGTVVRIFSSYEEKQPDGTMIDMVGLGSGVVFDPRGYVLTCAHVVPTNDFQISYYSSEYVIKDTGVKRPGLIGLVSRTFDLAIVLPSVNISKSDYDYAMMNEDEQVDIGKKLYSINHSNGMGYTGVFGYVSHRSRRIGGNSHGLSPNLEVFQILGMDGFQGCSGGPVFNENGEIFSLLNLRYNDQNVAIQPYLVRAFVNEFYKKLKVDQGKVNESKPMNKKRREEKRKGKKEIQNTLALAVYNATKEGGLSTASEMVGWNTCEFGKQLKINSDIITSFEKLKLLSDGPGQKEDSPNQFVKTVKRLRLMRRFEPHGKQLKINSDIITSCEKLKLLGDGPGQKEDLPNQFVKVYAHGVLLGRVIDLNVHSSYASLTQTVEDMFPSRPTIRKPNNVIRSAMETKYGGNSSDYVLGYEDKDGDLLLLVEDVPWSFFVQTVKRLRLIRSFESHGHG